MLVLCDNLDLEPGRCKLKLKGSPAAHNGLKSITAHIQSNDYMRIFLGVGHPGDRELVREWVVGDPDQSELPLYEEAYKKTAEAILGVLNGQTERVMNELNRKKAPERNP